jgi:hypothetical protein
MADPLSIAAGVAGLLAFAGATLTTGYSILASLTGSKSDIHRLLAELSQLTGVLVAIEAQEKAAKDGATGTQDILFSDAIKSSVRDCRQAVKKVAGVLDKLDKSRRAVQAVKWVLVEPEVRKLIEEIEHYRKGFVLSLRVDTRKKTDLILNKQVEISAQLFNLKEEHDRFQSTAQDERALHKRQALFKWLVPISEEKHAKFSKLRLHQTGQWLLTHP